jgi:hypothetical protein
MLIPELVKDLAAEVARLNDIAVDLAEDLVWAAGDVVELDSEGKRLVTLDGETLSLIWPED